MLIVLFKKGARLNCRNYRGISIEESLGEFYAKILENLEKYQAGDGEALSIYWHQDSSKAYYKVPRGTLIEILKSLGCGKQFLQPIILIYRNTVNILNSAYIKATIRVRQGGLMSCMLFILYLNKLAAMLKRLELIRFYRCPCVYADGRCIV